MPSSTYETIAVDATSTLTFATGDPRTQTHVVGNGRNRILLVGVGTRGNSVVGITYAGLALTLAKASTVYDQCVGYIYYLVNPPIGSNTISVDMSGTAATVMGALSLFNVDRVSPIYTTGEATNNGDLNLSLSVPFDYFLSFQCGFHTAASGVGALSGQTLFLNSFSNDGGFAAYENSLGAGSQGMNIDIPGTNAASMAGILVKPARKSMGALLMHSSIARVR